MKSQRPGRVSRLQKHLRTSAGESDGPEPGPPTPTAPLVTLPFFPFSARPGGSEGGSQPRARVRAGHRRCVSLAGGPVKTKKTRSPRRLPNAVPF